MIRNRRSFLLSIVMTAAALLLLAACDLGTSAPAQSVAAPSTDIPASTAVPTAFPAEAATARATETAAPATATPRPTNTPLPRGGTLTIGIEAPVAELKPWDLRSRAEEHVADLMYNGLVRLDDRLQPQPDLAENWTASPDGGVITFTLRSDVEWHDGEALTAEDVRWTLDTLRALTPTNSLLFDLRTVIGEVRLPLSNTVVLSLTQAYAPILADMAVPILPRHRLESRTPAELEALNFWDEPVGSGPFTLDERGDERTTFLPNDRFFRGAPLLDAVALVVEPDAQAAAESLDDGTLSIAEFPPWAPATSTLELADDLRSGSYPENGMYFVAFNMRENRLFTDRRVREALAIVLDLPALVRDVTGGRGVPLSSSVSPAAWAAPPQPAPAGRDLDRARGLLDEAGWELPPGASVRQRGGNEFVARLFVRADDPRRVQAAERIAAAAAEIGLQIEAVPSDFDPVMVAKLAPPYEFNLLLSSWVNAPNSAGFPTTRFYDPDDYAIFGSERVWRGNGDTREGLRNIGGFSNPDYDTEAQRARSTYDPQARAEAIAAAQAIIRAEYPYLFLWTDPVDVVASPTVRVDGGELALDSPRYLWNVEQWYVQ